VLTATNKDLRAEVAAGKFREDLFFRLHVIPLHLAPLRERQGDVPLLIEHFLRRNQRRHGLRPPRISLAGMEALVRHPWPGNVRELANILERVSILYAGMEVGGLEIRSILAADGPLPVDAAVYRDDDDRTLSDRLDDYERQLLLGALEYADGNVAEAARKLRTDRANLYRRMRRLDVAR
jgi:DNA-binding NtrC family response regulator